MGGGQDCSSVAKCLTTGVGQRYDAEMETLIPSHGGGFDVTAFAHQQGGSIDLHMSENCAPALQRSQTQAIEIKQSVRRLTPIECERLQGFGDNFTAIPWRNKSADECPDGPRYKALGNSMAVPVMRWIGQRINEVEKLK